MSALHPSRASLVLALVLMFNQDFALAADQAVSVSLLRDGLYRTQDQHLLIETDTCEELDGKAVLNPARRTLSFEGGQTCRVNRLIDEIPLPEGTHYFPFLAPRGYGLFRAPRGIYIQTRGCKPQGDNGTLEVRKGQMPSLVLQYDEEVQSCPVVRMYSERPLQ